MPARLTANDRLSVATRLTVAERLSYGLGNAGINLIFGMTGTYLMYFYTDVYRIDAGVVAGVFLVARGIDAVFDPLLGLLIDRTSTRFGKHRPYLIGLAVPFALCSVAVFSAPALSGTGRILYLYATYTLLGMLYSGLSLPLNSMLPTLTRDSAERTSTNALREFMGSSAAIGVGFVTLPLVHVLAPDAPSRGFREVAVIFGLFAVASMIVAFLNTRERVLPVKGAQIITTRQSLLAARGNLPWMATMLVNFCFWVGYIAHTQSFIYFANGVLGQPAFVSTLMLTMLAALVGTAASAYVANRIGKRMTGMIGSFLAAVATAALALSHAPGWLIAMNALAYGGLGLIGGLLFALMADAVDYGEWKSGFRAQGFLYAASSFGVKLGMSIGGAAGAWLLARSHYQPDGAVTPAIVASIDQGHIWLPVLSFVTMGLSLLLFRTEAAYRREAVAPPSWTPSEARPAIR